MKRQQVLILILLIVTVLAAIFFIAKTKEGNRITTTSSSERLAEKQERREQKTKSDTQGGSSTDSSTGSQPASSAEVKLLSQESCSSGTCYTVAVECGGLSTREAMIREIHGQGGSKGSILFTTGGFGTTLYGGLTNGEAGPDLFDQLHVAGFDTYEIAWQGEHGWAEGNAGAGLKSVMCAYPAVTRWITDEVARNSSAMCATGNSGGSMQNGYGLALYNLEDTLDFVLLSGGPPTSDAVNVCLSTDGVAVMDYTMGWERAGDYCRRDDVNAERRSALEKQSIATDDPGEIRDYSYDNTLVSFVEGAQDTLNIPRAQKYYDRITSPKLWIVLPGVPHGVPKTPSGSQEIVSQMEQYCKDRT